MRKWLIVFTLLLVVFPIAAQESTPETALSGGTDMRGEDMQNMAFVRFAHFAPDAGAVSLILSDDIPPSDSANFGTITDWMAVPAGTYQAAAGSTTAELGFAAQTFSTVAAVPAEDGGVKLEVIDETFPKLIPGTSYVTFVNALPNGTTVDLVRNDVVYIPALRSLGNADGVTSWTGLRDDSGTFTMRFMESGTADTVVADLGEIDITEGNLFLIALVPTAGSSGAEAIVHETPMADIWLVQGKMAEPGTVMDALRTNELLTPFADSLEQAGLADTLTGEGPYTLFIPAGFLMDDVPETVMRDNGAFQTWLQGYIVEGDLRSQDVANGETALMTLGGQTITPETREDGIYLNGVKVIAVNIPATNGTIHMINGLLGAETQQ